MEWFLIYLFICSFVHMFKIIFRRTLGFVGALDGIAIQVNKPSTKEVDATKPFIYRKGWHAVIGLGMCDSYCRFTFFDVSNPGSTPDLNCFKSSLLFQWIRDGTFPDWAIIGADKAFMSEQSHNYLLPFLIQSLIELKDL